MVLPLMPFIYLYYGNGRPGCTNDKCMMYTSAHVWTKKLVTTILFAKLYPDVVEGDLQGPMCLIHLGSSPKSLAANNYFHHTHHPRQCDLAPESKGGDGQPCRCLHALLDPLCICIFRMGGLVVQPSLSLHVVERLHVGMDAVL